MQVILIIVFVRILVKINYLKAMSNHSNENDDDQIALPSDWTNTECARLPFAFQNNSGVQFTVDDNNNNPMQFF